MRAPIPPLSRRNERGHKTRNPSFKPGGHWVICDVCGNAFREEYMRMRWDGYAVCPDDWEPRQPQDFVRAKFDRIAPEGIIRPDPIDIFISPLCSTRSAIVGQAVVGCAIVGGPPSSEIPDGTFNNGL